MPQPVLSIAHKSIAACALFFQAASNFAQSNQCSATSGETLTPVTELYISEGCSSCPRADKWASTLKCSHTVVQAFHVGCLD